jgi:hypothetical protein
MESITLLTKEDIKSAVLEVLSEMPRTTDREPEQYIYGLKDLAAFLGVGITTAWSLKKSGKLPYYQTGKKVFFKKSEILATTSKTL